MSSATNLAPPVFVGREDILSDIVSAADLGRETGQSEPGLTRVIQGAPGAGKSSILEELKRRSEENQDLPQVLLLNSARIKSPVDVLRPLAEMISPAQADVFLANYQHTMSAESGVTVPFIRAGAKAETTRTLVPQTPDWGAMRKWIDATESVELGGPVILAIDEAQRFHRDEEDPLAKLFQDVHDGCGLPIILVLAGLANTAERAMKMKLTRGRVDHDIGRFDRETARFLMTRFCKHFGLTGIEEAQGPLYALADKCDGWPRHLHFALQAVADQALVSDGDIRQADWSQIRRVTAISRQDYYRSQQSPEMESRSLFVAKIHHKLMETHNNIKMDDLLDFVHDRVVKDGFKYPSGITSAEDFVMHLTHQGAIQKAKNGSFSCPIPSFQAYLILKAHDQDLSYLPESNDWSMLGDDGLTPLHRAVHADDVPAVERMFMRFAFVGENDGNGMPPWDANIRDAQGNTPLHLARSPEMISALLDMGADPALADDSGTTPLTLATAESQTDHLTVLLEAMCQNIDDR